MGFGRAICALCRLDPIAFRPGIVVGPQLRGRRAGAGQRYTLMLPSLSRVELAVFFPAATAHRRFRFIGLPPSGGFAVWDSSRITFPMRAFMHQTLGHIHPSVDWLSTKLYFNN